MDVNEYRIRGKEMVDYIADYLENIRDRRVCPDKKPGFLHDQIPDSAPIDGEPWQKIFNDVDKIIMPGVIHWQSPHMHGYFPALTSYPSMLGEMLTNAINCIGFTWASSPAATELEMIVMNWLGKMIGLPEQFLHRRDTDGGGVIQTTASEATLVSLLAGRWQAIDRYKKTHPTMKEGEINCKLVAYCSNQAHSSIQKAALIGLVTIRYIDVDDDLSMRGDNLQKAINIDRETGLVPFWVCATLGTTGACAFDNLEEIGQVCRQEQLWLHVDAAYAGSAFICPEYRIWMKGIELVDSIAFNPSKWLMVHFDCTAMWVKHSPPLHNALVVNPVYLQYPYQGLAVDYMHWQIPLSKRFRALKLWFVLRNYGITGLQKHIRDGIRMAEKFEALVLSDVRFEIPVKRHLGLVCFRLIADNQVNEILWNRLTSRGNIHCVPAIIKDKYVIRFTVTSTRTTIEDIIKDWKEIKTVATDVLNEFVVNIPATSERTKIPLRDTRRNENFGTSLLLSNSPMSPKIINGSFAAIYDTNEIKEIVKFVRLRQDAQNSPSMRRRIRGILMSGKQFSLDSRLDLFHGIETTTKAKRQTNNVIDDRDNDDDDRDHQDQTTTKIYNLQSSLEDDDNDNNDYVKLNNSDAKFLTKSDININQATNVKKCSKCGHQIIQIKQ